MFYLAKIHIISGMECFFIKLSEKNKDECLADGACMAVPFVADGHKYPGVLLVLCDWYYPKLVIRPTSIFFLAYSCLFMTYQNFFLHLVLIPVSP